MAGGSLTACLVYIGALPTDAYVAKSIPAFDTGIDDCKHKQHFHRILLKYPGQGHTFEATTQ